MGTRGFVIRNFRNVGLCKGNKSQEAFLHLPELEGEFGGLIILLGKHNSGKSNVLMALKKFGDSCLYLEGSQNSENLNLLSQDDIPKSPSKLTSLAFVYQEPAYYLHYPQEVATKSGEAQKKRQMGESFDFGTHLAELQNDFNHCDIYLEQKKHENIDFVKLLLKNISGSGRFIRCTIEPFKSHEDFSSDELNVERSKRLRCPFVVGYKALDVKQNFADYVNGTSQHVESSILREYGHIICLEDDKKMRKQYYNVRMNEEGNENILLYRHFQKTPDEKHQQLHIPKIVLYKEVGFCDDDLSTAPDKIRESKLFRGGITKKLMQINHDFNALYGEDGEENYRFELNIDVDKFALEIYKGEQLLSLEKQGSGFERLFNFVFSLAQQIDGLEKGDIVLIDDVEKSLSGSIQTRLRKYLKELAQKRGILFIVSTHSPFMIDCNCLDEIRILKPQRNGLGTEIVELANPDETIKENELDYIADIVGVDLRKFSEVCKQE